MRKLAQWSKVKNGVEMSIRCLEVNGDNKM